MDIRQHVSLKDYSTMRLGGTAAYMVDVHNEAELKQAAAWAEERSLPVLMIGGGSNIIWRDEGFAGLVIVNKILGLEEQTEPNGNILVTIGAGENWDSVVEQLVAKGLTGVEALSLIPGTAGATPVQNVGAYGQEIAQTLVSVAAYDRQAKADVTIPASDCGFGYRTSRFKTNDHGRFLITHITLRLRHGNPQPPFYGAVEEYFRQHNVENPTPQVLRDAVITIRTSKLPDPAKVANNGSFFANPIVDQHQLTELLNRYSDMPHWPVGEGKAKIPAAWLMEKAGLKDTHDPETGMATWPKQPLVLVNEHATSTAQLLTFRQKILDRIKEQFAIELVQEPEILP